MYSRVRSMAFSRNKNGETIGEKDTEFLETLVDSF